MNDLHQRVVAVVDDDDRIQESLKDLLESAGYQARTFGSGRAFLDSDALRVADALISDVRMPEIDGWQLAAITQRERPGLPVIIVTGQNGLPPPPALRTIVTVFRKPFDGQALLEALKVALAAA